MIRLGSVPYLNALPLYRVLESHRHLDIVRAVPSRLSTILRTGQCDAALIPVVEWFRGAGKNLVSDGCVGCDGPVRSVLLFHKTEISNIQSVAADASSRTSVALLRVILADLFHIEPRFSNHAPSLNLMLENHDAALIIGDPALEAAQNVPPNIRVLDLGAAWKELTGLPFVFAVWIGRHGLSDEQKTELQNLLNAARDAGTQMFETIAQDAATEILPAPLIESYLREAIQFTITDEHQKAMDEFRARCEKHKLI
jgi:chorismate dehydratase